VFSTGKSCPMLAAMTLTLAGCGASAPVHPVPIAAEPSAARPAAAKPRLRAVTAKPAPRALVTAETENRLIVVDLRRGRVIRRIAVPADPENVVVRSLAVVVNSTAGAVTLVDPYSLRIVEVLGGFGSPHIPAISPDGKHAYVTDDARGTLSVIDLFTRRVASRIAVGPGAHHLSFRPDQRRVWLALGESARRIVMLDTSEVAGPRVIGQFDPGFRAHDLAFSPDGRRVWVTSAIGRSVAVFRARDHRRLFDVPVGPPPQHLVFGGRFAYLTSGYGGTIEKVDATTGRVLRRASAPYGSFELDTADGFVVASSLLRGTLSIYDSELRHPRVLRVAPAARDVAIATR
jgi:YVTN family beta-propeller protein